MHVRTFCYRGVLEFASGWVALSGLVRQKKDPFGPLILQQNACDCDDREDLVSRQGRQDRGVDFQGRPMVTLAWLGLGVL